MTKYYYLENYADEIMPYDATLTGAALFLATGKAYKDDERDFFQGKNPHKSGEIFKMYISEIVWAGRVENLPNPAPQYKWCAIARGPNQGWGPDDVAENVEELDTKDRDWLVLLVSPPSQNYQFLITAKGPKLIPVMAQ